MGLFDFIKKGSNAKFKSAINASVELKDSTLQEAVETRLGIVSTIKVYLDFSSHASLQNRFIAFDVNASSDRIIELGAVIFENGIPMKAFSSLVNPGIAVPAATAINHITNAGSVTWTKFEELMNWTTISSIGLVYGMGVLDNSTRAKNWVIIGNAGYSAVTQNGVETAKFYYP